MLHTEIRLSETVDKHEPNECDKTVKFDPELFLPEFSSSLRTKKQQQRIDLLCLTASI